jgi:hypothetical protein
MKLAADGIIKKLLAARGAKELRTLGGKTSTAREAVAETFALGTVKTHSLLLLVPLWEAFT